MKQVLPHHHISKWAKTEAVRNITFLFFIWKKFSVQFAELNSTWLTSHPLLHIAAQIKTSWGVVCS